MFDDLVFDRAVLSPTGLVLRIAASRSSCHGSEQVLQEMAHAQTFGGAEDDVDDSDVDEKDIVDEEDDDDSFDFDEYEDEDDFDDDDDDDTDDF